VHSRSWNRCLAFDPESGAWCRRRPSDGVFCPPHAWEFRCDEAAKAATRLVRAELVVRNPSASPFQRWWAERQAGRARSLRQVLLADIEGTEGSDISAIKTDNPVRRVDVDH